MVLISPSKQDQRAVINWLQHRGQKVSHDLPSQVIPYLRSPSVFALLAEDYPELLDQAYSGWRTPSLDLNTANPIEKLALFIWLRSHAAQLTQTQRDDVTRILSSQIRAKAANKQGLESLDNLENLLLAANDLALQDADLEASLMDLLDKVNLATNRDSTLPGELHQMHIIRSQLLQLLSQQNPAHPFSEVTLNKITRSQGRYVDDLDVRLKIYAQYANHAKVQSQLIWLLEGQVSIERGNSSAIFTENQIKHLLFAISKVDQLEPKLKPRLKGILIQPSIRQVILQDFPQLFVKAGMLLEESFFDEVHQMIRKPTQRMIDLLHLVLPEGSSPALPLENKAEVIELRPGNSALRHRLAEAFSSTLMDRIKSHPSPTTLALIQSLQISNESSPCAALFRPRTHN